MAIKNTLSMIWRNRRHFKMQIFGAMVLFTVLVFVINLITINVNYKNKLSAYMQSNVQYTNSFQMSLSGVKGTVDKIYIDSTRTQCFLLMSLRSTGSLTTTAGNYQMFLTNVDNNGASTGTPDENIRGEIYMFGSTGIVGLYLKSDVPFENSLKELVFRSYAKFTSNTLPYYRKSATDAQYDQCHIYFNPGGSNAKSIDFLEKHVDGTQFDLTEIYRQVNSVSKEITIRNNILQCYKDMNTAMSRIGEYHKRLTNDYNVSVPDLPKYIANDYFDMVSIFNSAGEQVGTYEKFYPATIVPGGTDYDWYMGSILKGYYKLVPNTKKKTELEYINSLADDKFSRTKPDVKIKEWFFQDGTEVQLEGNLTPYGQEVANNIQLYQDQLTSYLELKTKYQTKYLPELLELEYNSANTIVSYTVRNDENTVLVY